jgi:hypothetical protein
MARITVNEAGIEHMTRSPLGPVVRDLQRRAENVVALATRRAGGAIIDIESGQLYAGIKYRIEQRTQGPIAIISTDATSEWRGQPFSYPAYHDQQTGRPWLSGALRAAMLDPGEAV